MEGRAGIGGEATGHGLKGTKSVRSNIEYKENTRRKVLAWNYAREYKWRNKRGQRKARRKHGKVDWGRTKA